MDKPIGRVTHFYDKIGVAVIELSDALKAGEKIHIKGHMTDFEQVVDSMQVEHKTLAEAKKGDAIGLKVKDRVHEHDMVFRVPKE